MIVVNSSRSPEPEAVLDNLQKGPKSSHKLGNNVMSNGYILSSYSLLQSAENEGIPNKYLTKNSSVKINDEGKSLSKKKQMIVEDMKMKLCVYAGNFPTEIDPHALL